MGLFSSLFKRSTTKPNLAELISEGAVILDVRSKGEFQQGHIKGAVNIPLDQLEKQLGKLKRDKQYITCCASGMRSASAKSLLRKKGFDHVENGGSWLSLKKYFR